MRLEHWVLVVVGVAVIAFVAWGVVGAVVDYYSEDDVWDLIQEERETR